jgi:hypothetical protein
MFAYLHRISQPLVGIISNLNFINDLHTHKLMVELPITFRLLRANQNTFDIASTDIGSVLFLFMIQSLVFQHSKQHVVSSTNAIPSYIHVRSQLFKNRIFWSFFDSLWHRSFWENERTEVQFLKLSQTMYELDCVQVWNERDQLVATSSSMRSMSSSFSTLSAFVFQL